MIAKNKNSRNLLVTIGAVPLLGLGGYLLLHKNNDQAPPADSNTNSSPPAQTNNSEVDQNKKDVVSNGSNNTDSGVAPTGSSRKKVVPVLSVSQESPGADVEANGYVPSIVELDGKCTLTLTMGSSKRTKTGNAFNDAQSTNCGLITIPRSSLSAGLWKATLSYSSSKYFGTSSPADIEVK